MASIIPVISREIDLSAYKSIQAGKSRRISVFPDNSTSYTSSSSNADIFFSVPQVKNGFCVTNATQLVFDITANATFTGTDPALQLSGGLATSVIQSLETILQNNSIENTLNYNVLAGMIQDLQPLGRSTTLGTFQGAGASAKIGATLSGTTGVDGVTIRCAIPLYSGLLGVGAEQWAYLGMDGLRLRMTMATTAVALKYVTTTLVTNAVYKISNMALQLEVFDVDQMTMNALAQEAGGVLKQHIICSANYQSSVPASSANSILIPARFSSVKGLLVAFRLAANLASPEIYAVPTDRLQPQLSQYFFTIDGANVPSVPVRCGASATSIFSGEVMSELQKVFGGSNSTAFDCVFTQAQFNNLTGTTGTGSFMIGVNFESQDSASHALISGRDLNSSNVYLNLQSYGTSLSAVADAFALYDAVVSYNLADGSVSLSK